MPWIADSLALLVFALLIALTWGLIAGCAALSGRGR
jgi:hypothetical protein